MSHRPVGRSPKRAASRHDHGGRSASSASAIGHVAADPASAAPAPPMARANPGAASERGLAAPARPIDRSARTADRGIPWRGIRRPRRTLGLASARPSDACAKFAQDSQPPLADDTLRVLVTTQSMPPMPPSSSGKGCRKKYGRSPRDIRCAREESAEGPRHMSPRRSSALRSIRGPMSLQISVHTSRAGAAQSPRILDPQRRTICIVAKERQLRPPAHPHRVAGTEHDLDGRPEALRPRSRRTERRLRPINLAQSPPRFTAVSEKFDAVRPIDRRPHVSVNPKNGPPWSGDAV